MPRRADPNRKFCPRCEKEKPRKDFYVRSNGQSVSVCKSCNSDHAFEHQITTLYRQQGFEGVINRVNQHIELAHKTLNILRRLEGK